MNTLRVPSAWMPIVLSIGILLMEFYFLYFVGVHPEQEHDEGVAAHLFQLWLLLEIVLVPLFALRWVPRAPRPALMVLAFQIALVIAGCFPVYMLQL